MLLLLLLLLLLRPAGAAPPPTGLASTSDPLRPSTGCLGAGKVPGALSTDAPADLDAPCAPSATCPSGGRRFPRQAATSQPPRTLQYSASKADEDEFLSPCGFSYERDTTLRDPEAMARR
ncbi:hypothetical protein EI555_007469 [Monodon monoceros]|uniref:Uncharacterized protein n=1 Tax=Monodon monoceros TaxID=40151 RepID=A0A4U1EC24_MONMO|nr:hypothetical protein EI555_007469 [Monodon monoceros]